MNRLTSVFKFAAPLCLVCTLANVAAGQAAAPTSDSVMGFETSATWTASASSTPPGFTVSSTSTRTQGSAAYAVANPPNMVKLVSQPVSNTAAALTGLGTPGAAFRLDIFIPRQQGNSVNSGWIQPYLTSPSRGLSKVPLAQVYFNAFQPGIFNTLSFPILGAVNTALAGAVFTDLTFEFDLNSPGKITGTYVLDNLRVHSPPTDSAALPPNYGHSVDLLVIGNTPTTSTFTAEVVQVPGDFVFIKPVDVPSTSLRLDLGYDGNSSFNCTYGVDPSDPTNLHYILTSCTNGMQAGDLVGASWARLAILNGDDTGKLRAQLASNPIGDLTGRGIIPPMPTFWGGAFDCTPAPAKAPTAMPITQTQSCVNQVSQANQIASKYLQGLNIPASFHDWVVAPTTPDFAIRHGNGAPNNNLVGPPPKNDPPFDDEGHLNPGGDYDAYWQLSGNLTSSQAGGPSDEGKTHFQADLGIHAVAFGYDIDAVDVDAVLDTDTGRTTPAPSVMPSASGTLDLYIFGLQTRHYSADPGTAFNVNVAGLDDDITLAKIQIWIFSIEPKIGVSAGLSASGGITGAGPNLISFGPTADLQVSLTGGIDIGIASGGVSVQVDLLKVGTPIVVNAKWTTDNDPRKCALTVTYTLSGRVQFSSGGGEVDLVASFGPCPFCYKESETIFNWSPLAYSDIPLFDVENTPVDFELPQSMCTQPLTVTVDYPPQSTTLSANLPVTLSGHAIGNAGGIPCSDLSWTFTPGANAGSPGPGGSYGFCSPVVDFPGPSGTTSTWTINLNASATYTDKFNRTITETGSASVPVTIASLSNGAYILEMTDSSLNVYTPVSGNIGLLDPGAPSTSPYSATFTFYGSVVGASGATTTTFSAPNGTITTSNGNTSTPSAVWSVSAVPIQIDGTTYYFLPATMITMTTKDSSNNTFGSSVNVTFSVLQ